MKLEEQLRRHSLGWVVARRDDQLVGFGLDRDTGRDPKELRETCGDPAR
jgi:hypothetical protein